MCCTWCGRLVDIWLKNRKVRHRADCRRTGLLLGDGRANPVIDAEVVRQAAEVPCSSREAMREGAHSGTTGPLPLNRLRTQEFQFPHL